MTNILHPFIILFPTLCVSFFCAKKLGHHASFVFVALISSLALLTGIFILTGIFTTVIPISLSVTLIYALLYIASLLILITHRKTLLQTIKSNWVWTLVLALIYSLWLGMDKLVTRWDNFRVG